jgi:hypothetical protein
VNRSGVGVSRRDAEPLTTDYWLPATAFRYTGPQRRAEPNFFESALMGELNEGRWAVMSERGCEALGLTYAAALELERRLKGERMGGLCVITDAAGRRLPPAKETGAPADASPKRPRRAAKGKPAV